MTVEWYFHQHEIDNFYKVLWDKSYCKIGVFGRPAAYIAGVHEFGARVPVTSRMRGWFKHYFNVKLRADTTHIEIPERSFLRPVGYYETPRFSSWLIGNHVQLMKMIMAGPQMWHWALKAMASVWVENVKRAFVTNGWGGWRALSELTLSKRAGGGAGTPLVSTGKLRDSIKHVLVEK